MIGRLIAVPIAAFMWAKLEVEIEGKDGWAKNLPTWRINNHFLLDVFLGGRPLTGFHTWAFSFVFFAFHLPLLWMQTWSWPLEVQVIGSVMLFWVVEDFIWFIVNPHYGWKRYRQHDVTWHPKWFWLLPVDHWGMLVISLSLLVWSCGK